ncbi:MAG TPA: peptidylprolyl isomerase [Holophagaceae bacterium]|nr:peptidylprolyl isomerase [Holophagaceae bacterium]
MRFTALLPLLAVGLAAQAPAKPTKAVLKTTDAKATDAKKPETLVLARIGGQVLTDADVDALLDSMPAQQKMQFQMSPEGRPRLVQQLTEMMLLSAKARQQGLDKTPAFKANLRRTTDALLTQEFMKKHQAELQEKVKVSEEQVKAYFEAHKDQYKKGETYDARHILVGKRPEGADKDRTDEELAARVKEVQAELAAGKPFDELVEKYTDDPGSKTQKGLYTGIGLGKFVPEFEKAALTQEVGKVGEPVKTAYGFHLIRVEKRTPPADAAFEEVKAQVQQAAQAARQTEVWDEFLGGLRKEIPYEVTAKLPAKPADKAGAKPAVKPALHPAAKPEVKPAAEPKKVEGSK